MSYDSLTWAYHGEPYQNFMMLNDIKKGTKKGCQAANIIEAYTNNAFNVRLQKPIEYFFESFSLSWKLHAIRCRAKTWHPFLKWPEKIKRYTLAILKTTWCTCIQSSYRLNKQYFGITICGKRRKGASVQLYSTKWSFSWSTSSLPDFWTLQIIVMQPLPHCFLVGWAS